MHTIRFKDQNILLLSDTHGMHRLIDIPEDIQIVIHSGDICNDGNEKEIEDFFKWYADLNIKHKIFVHGNHDLPFELEPEDSYNLVPSNVHWLNDNSISISNIKIKAISPFFYFEAVNDIEKCDILVSHYPPLGILDDGIGSQELTEHAAQSKPTFVIFGHNHPGYGLCQIAQTTYINASLYNELCQKEKR